MDPKKKLNSGIKTVPDRRCFECGVEIKECMGFVFAGEFLQMLQDQSIGRPFKVPKELCGKCGAKKLVLN